MNAPVQQPVTTTWSMYRAIVGIGALCALLIVGVFKATEGRIADNRARFLAESVAEVLPEAEWTLAVTVDASGALVEAGEDTPLPGYLGFDADGNIVGAVITGIGMGYADNIRVIFAYSFELDAFTGFKILESKETPGLGDRVEVEPHFLGSFDRLDASLNAAGDALANAIVTVKEGEKVSPWEIDGITGATITSEAIGNILNEAASSWVPALERDADSFAGRSPTEESE
ncbi:MAG: FMN-binding protein [Woeseiaceae bacterium]|nr:FMN-binding protein [Woeseiaceae bacterium]